MRLIIIGCGRMGADLAKLLSSRGHALTVVDHHPDAFARLGPSFAGRTITGTGFDRGVLLDAGIERADGLAALTGGDEVNVVTARLASLTFHVPRVVARLYDPRKAEIYRRLGLQTICPSTWGVNRAAELLTFSELNTCLSMGGGEVELVEFALPPTLAGRTVSDLAIPGQLQVATITRNGKALIPNAGTRFEQGDVVYLVLATAAAEQLNRLLAVA
jgi:trk system potassium uptake protein TrkA